MGMNMCGYVWLCGLGPAWTISNPALPAEVESAVNGIGLQHPGLRIQYVARRSCSVGKRCGFQTCPVPRGKSGHRVVGQSSSGELHVSMIFFIYFNQSKTTVKGKQDPSALGYSCFFQGFILPPQVASIDDKKSKPKAIRYGLFTYFPGCIWKLWPR